MALAPSLARMTARLRSYEAAACFQQRSAVRPATVPLSEFERRQKRRAAVLVPLCVFAGKLSLLFTLRSQSVGSHRGHVSFPGGHIDAAETAEGAALREFDEEVGRDTRCGVLRVLGSTPPVQAVTGTMVTPVLGVVAPVGVAAEACTKRQLELGARLGGVPPCSEVERYFTLPVAELLLPQYREEQDLGYRGTVARFL
eukprot:g4981.t1